MPYERAVGFPGPPDIGERVRYFTGCVAGGLGNMLSHNSPQKPEAVKAMFLDLDGTILIHQEDRQPDGTTGIKHVIHSSTLGYIRRAITEKDVMIIPVSGRAPASMDPYIRAMGIENAIYIAHHGAWIGQREGQKDKLIGETPIEAENAKAVIEAFGSLGLEDKANLLYFNANAVPHKPTSSGMLAEYKGRNPDLIYIPLSEDARPQDYLRQGLPHKLIVLATGQSVNGIKETLGEKLKNAGLEIMISNGMYVEIINVKATKGRAVRTTLVHLYYARGIRPKSVISFGDGPSDLTIPSRARVGRFYLLGNAPDDLKKRAKGMATVTVLEETNEQDAVGRVIASVVLNEPYKE